MVTIYQIPTTASKYARTSFFLEGYVYTQKESKFLKNGLEITKEEYKQNIQKKYPKVVFI